MRKHVLITMPENSPLATLSAEARKRVLFQASGKYGHTLMVMPDIDINQRLVILTKGDRVIMSMPIMHDANRGKDDIPPLIDFLQQAFIRDFWCSAEHRKYQQGAAVGHARQNWSELMRDCNTIGYWLNGNRPIRDIDNDDIEQQHYVVPLRKMTLPDEYDATVSTIGAVTLRFLCRRAQATREVGVADLDKNLEHLMVSSGFDAATMNQRSYIQQTFTYEKVSGDDVYEFVGRNELPPDADPHVLVFNEHTTFMLKHIRIGRAERFLRARESQHRNEEWAQTHPVRE